MEAFKNSDFLVVATTGGSNTAQLKQKYPYENIIIEDFIPFEEVMPYANIYITNGGYGGAVLGIQHEIPMIVAGIHEGKGEINARVGYFKIGINLKTERPTSKQLKNAVTEIFNTHVYQQNIRKLNDEFSQYDTEKLFISYVSQLLTKQKQERYFSEIIF
jgi:UDP:flavonoid glycosyltransferase YjiC (YdhE family)